MPPATAWGWNPQLLAAGSAYATYSAEATKVRKAMADEKAEMKRRIFHWLCRQMRKPR